MRQLHKEHAANILESLRRMRQAFTRSLRPGKCGANLTKESLVNSPAISGDSGSSARRKKEKYRLLGEGGRLSLKPKS